MNARPNANDFWRDLPLRLIWTVINMVQFVLTLLWSALCIVLALVVHVVTRSQRLPLLMARRLWAPGLLFLAMARIRVEGMESFDSSQPCVLVANHESMIDICALFHAFPLPLRFLLKYELSRMPLLGWYTRAMGMIGIERGRSRAALASIREAVALVKSGATLAAFPEGTRGHTGAVKTFKSGPFQVAIAAGVPILPVALIGTGEVLPPGGFWVRPGRITVRIGQPIATTGMDEEDRRELAERTREIIIGMLPSA